jgi:3',5'-cyclic-AMP phosphodiesterase
MRIAWITDPHLNHCSLPAWERMIDQIAIADADSILVTGDISEGEDVVFQLLRLADATARQIYVVLGNHDFYHSSIARTRVAVSTAAAKHPLLHYLHDIPAIPLSPTCALVGVDGWGDATQGDYERSIVKLNDFQLIDDFWDSPTTNWRSTLEALGRDSADRLRIKLDAACKQYPSILVGTHVPPFRESCWYEGRTTDDHWAPFFVCGSTGEVLREMANKHPNSSIKVFCGHTHHGGAVQISANLQVTTGAAVYGQPVVQSIIEIP